MKRNARIALILLSLSLLTTTGCWSQRELNHLSIIGGIGIDFQDGRYHISTQIINPVQVAQTRGGGTSGTPVSVFSKSGNTILEAFQNMMLIIPREAFFAHVRLVVIGEALAREEGITKLLDILSRNYEMRTDFYVLVAKESSAEEVLKIQTSQENVPAMHTYFSLQIADKNLALTNAVQLDQLIEDLVSGGKHPVLPGIRIHGSPAMGNSSKNIETIESAVTLELEEMAAFQNGKLIGWLDGMETKGYNFITNHLFSTITDIGCPENETDRISIQLLRSNTNISSHFEHHQPTFQIDVQAEGSVTEVNCALDLNQAETIYELEVRSEQKFKSMMEQILKKAQEEWETDLFGFGDVLYRKHPDQWERMKEDWDHQFAQSPINIAVNVELRRTDSIHNSYIQEIKE
ncbi:Ger(x)C family spore germination protein [Marinicrinis sediminis]|uniref:Ger(X)C family spore germination protein n=1 Tax=Marinicrinis sediminis TaxID=1652465 RepID=A0ABW5RFD0_9BACL